MIRYALIPLGVTAAAAGAQTTVAATKVAAADKPVCRILTPTGSIMGTRVCKPRKEWAAGDAAYQDAIDRRRSSNTVERSQGRGNGLEY